MILRCFDPGLGLHRVFLTPVWKDGIPVRTEPESIQIWKFGEAPQELRSLVENSRRPEWVALVPQRIYAADLDVAISNQLGPECVERHKTSTGDIVYAGYRAVDPFLAAVALTREKNVRGAPRDR